MAVLTGLADLAVQAGAGEGGAAQSGFAVGVALLAVGLAVWSYANPIQKDD